MVDTASAYLPSTRYEGTYRCEPAQVRFVRSALADVLGGCDRADDVILVASELAANAAVHSWGDSFTVRCEVHHGYVWVEVEDRGGLWLTRQRDARPHGFDVVHALAGEDNWGVDGGPAGWVAWARLLIVPERKAH